MSQQARTPYDDFDDPDTGPEEQGETPEEDLWFLPGPEVQTAEVDFIAPGPRAPLPERSIILEWEQAQADLAMRLARVAGRLGALDDRVLRGPEGWRRRLALIEAAELSWISGDRVSADRLGLWMSLRVSGAEEDGAALLRAGWAVRRLSGGPGPEAGLPGFLDRRDPEESAPDGERIAERAAGWQEIMAQAERLHPITRAAMGFHLWSLAGLNLRDGRMEAAVTAARIAATGAHGTCFAPLAMGGAGGLQAGGAPVSRLLRWLDGMDRAILTAMRHLDDIDAWSIRADRQIQALSGKTPAALCNLFTDWPLISAPMAEAQTKASRAAVQRNLNWMERHGLIREVTGQGRYRVWKIA